MSETLLVAIIAAFGAIIAAWVQSERSSRFQSERDSVRQKAEHDVKNLMSKLEGERAEYSRKISQVELSYHSPKPIAAGEYRCSIMLVGLGNSGKTQLIRTLLDAPEADPSQKTMDYSIYHKRLVPAEAVFGKQSSSFMEKRVTNFFVSDYRGQNVGSLVSSFIYQQKIPNSAMQYGFVNSLIIVVDAVSPASVHSPHPVFDERRIQDHLREWNASAIDAIFGMLTADSLKFMCLFINKSDAVRAGVDPKPDRAVLDEFETLVEILHKRCPADTRFEVLYGSAKTGEGVQSLLSTWLKLA